MTIEGRRMAAGGGVLRYGMIGGGRGAFIGGVHRQAIAMDGLANLVAGCFSASYDGTLDTGSSLGLARERLYRDYRAPGPHRSETRRWHRLPRDRPRPIASTTPSPGWPSSTASHVDAARSRSPRRSRRREHWAALTKRKGLVFGVTYTYSGYPIVRHMREMVSAANSATSGSSPPSIPRSGWPRRSSGPARSRRPGAPTPSRRDVELRR